MAVLSAENSEKEAAEEECKMILKSAKLVETDEKRSISNTRDLLRKAKEAANQKFALTINNQNLDSPIADKIVLKGEESPAWHGQLIKTKLKRIKTTEQTKKKTRTILKTSADTTTNNLKPASKSLFEFYKKVRGEYEDFREIEAIRLQKRLEKFSDFPQSSKKLFEEYEREIVPWQSDSSTKACYLCSEDFTLINRRHHCRLCGRIICSSSDCMANIPIKLENGMAKELKSCTKCYKFLFKKSQIKMPSPIEERMNSLFRKINSLKSQLLETIPRFNEYLLEESVTEARPLKEWRQDAWTLRDTLILYSVHFRSTVQELAELAENEALEKPVFRVLANNLRRSGNEFLQKHMFTLQILDLNSGETKEPVAVITETENATEPGNNSGLKGQIKKLFPSLMNELFKVSSSCESGLLEFYNDEGDLIPLTDAEMVKEALGNKEQVLKEQLQQLEREITSKPDDDESQETREMKNETIKRAIYDVKNELYRLQKLKIQ